MTVLFDTLNAEGHLDGLDLNKDEILRNIGLGQVVNGVFKWSDLYAASGEDCYDTAIKAVRYQEYVAEILALTQKRRGTIEANLDRILNSTISGNKGLKITEAKALAKGSDDYVKKLEEVESLKSWEDFLKRFIDVLEKYHYLAKNRLSEIQNNFKKGM